MKEKIAICGTHGVGKSKICRTIYAKYKVSVNIDDFEKLEFIPEQFREVVKDIYKFEKQTEEITLATYAKPLYLENLYTAQGKNILCDRSVLDTFVYFLFNGYIEYKNNNKHVNAMKLGGMFGFNFRDAKASDLLLEHYSIAIKQIKTYSKIYLIEPSDREIENDGFRMTDKEKQLEIHKLFLEYFKDFPNVEIINQEDAHKPEFIKRVVREFRI